MSLDHRLKCLVFVVVLVAEVHPSRKEMAVVDVEVDVVVMAAKVEAAEVATSECKAVSF